MPSVGKTTAGVRAASGVFGSVTPADQYRFFIKAAQPVGSGNAADLSGKGANATIDAGTTDAAVWANAGFMTSTGAVPGAGKGLTVAAVASKSPLNWDLSRGQSLLLAMQVNFPALPTGSASRQFSGDLTSIGGVSVLVGEASLAGGAGRLAVRVRDSSGNNNTYMPTIAAPLLVAGQTHNVVVWIDGTAKTMTVYVDGVASGFQSAQSLASLVGATVANAGFNFGYYGDGAAASGTTNAKFANVHALVFDTVPLNIDQLITLLNRQIVRVVEKRAIKS